MLVGTYEATTTRSQQKDTDGDRRHGDNHSTIELKKGSDPFGAPLSSLLAIMSVLLWKQIGSTGGSRRSLLPPLTLAAASQYQLGTCNCFSSSTPSLADAETTPGGGLNINHALKKAQEGDSFSSLAKQPVTTLQGIGPVHEEALAKLGLKTIDQLANYKFFHLAKSLSTLATVEENDQKDVEMGAGTATRSSSSSQRLMNVNKGVDKAYEAMSLEEVIRQPVHALQGLTPAAGESFQTMGVKTIHDLAHFKYCHWAEAIAVAAKFEE